MDSNMISSLLAFASAVLVCLITQIATNHRHEKELNRQQQERIDALKESFLKQLEDIKSEFNRQFDSVKTEFNKQWMDVRDQVSEVRASCQNGDAVMQVTISELTREVRKHNGFAERMPVVEAEIKMLDKRMSEIERKGDN